MKKDFLKSLSVIDFEKKCNTCDAYAIKDGDKCAKCLIANMTTINCPTCQTTTCGYFFCNYCGGGICIECSTHSSFCYKRNSINFLDHVTMRVQSETLVAYLFQINNYDSNKVIEDISYLYKALSEIERVLLKFCGDAKNYEQFYLNYISVFEKIEKSRFGAIFSEDVMKLMHAHDKLLGGVSTAIKTCRTMFIVLNYHINTVKKMFIINLEHNYLLQYD